MEKGWMSRMPTIDMKIREVMSTNIVTIGPEKSVSEAVKRMMERDVECLPVVRSKVLQGMITFRDIIEKVVYVRREPDRIKVRDVMAKRMITCGPNSTIIDAVKLMKNRKLRRIPVVDKSRRLVGLVTNFDLAIFGWEI
jgi:CBS domain-containing protein